jgi:hypothetical protein
MPIVLVRPRLQLAGSFVQVGVASGIFPFMQRGFDEALSLAVGLRRVGLGPDVLQAKLPADVPEGDGADGVLVGHCISEGDARGVVDADMHRLPADTAPTALAPAVTGDAMPDPVEAAELPDVEMDHVAGVLAHVAARRRLGIDILHAAEPHGSQHAADGGGETPLILAICLPGIFLRRSATISSRTACGVWWRSL